MLPLCFPTVVSEPRLFVRKISFKLRVMRLNCIELSTCSYCIFTVKAARRGGTTHGQGWSVAARTASKGSHPRPAYKGQLPAAMPHGATTDDQPARDGYSPDGVPPNGVSPEDSNAHSPAGAAASAHGEDRQRVDATDGGTQRCHLHRGGDSCGH
ncbi:hypothetical protein B296_00045222 [Ensete ventricosum]|uniref:Uncharacterized protein n=1 Tax=Ensete ventricosum TaxID=4639 RepID=A0A426Z1M1_ENSVE|nr:hypothetical protein B296_00045222 [Ensete ventricosum]